MLPYSLAREQRHQLSAANLGTSFLLYLTINSEPLHGHTAKFWDKPVPPTAQRDLPPGD